MIHQKAKNHMTARQHTRIMICRDTICHAAQKLAVCLFFLFLLTGCGRDTLPSESRAPISASSSTIEETQIEDSEAKDKQTEILQTEALQEEPPKAAISYPTLPGFTLSSPTETDLVPDRVRQFLEDDPKSRDVHAYRSQNDVPRSVVLRWHTEEKASNSFQVLVSETADFSAALAYETRECEISILNLKTDCDYYWTVLADFSGHTYTAGTGFFHTLPGPRFLQVNGDRTGNFRDIGGYRTCFDVPVKQGVAYRGTEVNGKHNVSEAGRYLLTEILGIRMELDLRGKQESGDLSESPLGNQIAYLRIPAASYSDFLTAKSTAILFAELAKAENYPLYFHCVWGADRTGSLAAVLLALLGVEEEDILVDYELTSFGGSGERNRRSDQFSLFWDLLNQYEGGKLHEKAENLVTKEYGLSLQQISNIRSIFLYSGVTFGSQSLSARSARPGRSIYLYLNNFTEITAADIDGIPADFKVDKEGISIQLPDSLSPGEVAGHLEVDGTPLTFTVIVRGN